MLVEEFNLSMMGYIGESPTPFHAVSNVKVLLEEAGFAELNEKDAWDLLPNSQYFVTRNGSSLVAFTTGSDVSEVLPIRMAGAHTDSPCLRVKPHPEINKKGYFQLGVEVYGGALLNPWFDRDLSLAGRVSYLNGNGERESALVNFERPIAIIPSLAIHLDREANANKSINPQLHLPPVLLRITSEEKVEFAELLKEQLQKQYESISIARVMDYELSFYDTQKPAFVGMNSEFVASARLDNLLSSYVLVQALIDSKTDKPALVVLNDHEEVGSMSAEGAQGPFLLSVLERIYDSQEKLRRALSSSVLISADNAHGVHPNFSDKHDENHGPIINKGPVIKINNNQRYATNSETSTFYRHMSELEKVPYQTFVVRSDMGCGSTIGPITSSTIGVKTLDIGVPQFAMHSIREVAGSDDAHCLYRVMKRIFGTEKIF